MDSAQGADPYSSDNLVMLGFAALSIVAFALAWSGVWRSWVGTVHERVPLSLSGACGSMILGIWLMMAVPGRAGAVVGGPLVAASLVLLVFVVVEPRWWGPRWYREVKRERREAAAARRARRRAGHRAGLAPSRVWPRSRGRSS